MNEDMVLKWNQVVKPDDTVYILGDFSMAFQAVETFSQRLTGTKYLVPGNHDFCHSYHKKSKNKENRQIWIQKYCDRGFTVLPEQVTLDIPNIGILNMCHHPYSDGLGANEGKGHDKYGSWRPVDDGKTLLCGHIHEKWLTKRSPKGTLMINVGVDVHGFVPVSIDQIATLITKINADS